MATQSGETSVLDHVTLARDISAVLSSVRQSIERGLDSRKFAGEINIDYASTLSGEIESIRFVFSTIHRRNVRGITDEREMYSRYESGRLRLVVLEKDETFKKHIGLLPFRMTYMAVEGRRQIRELFVAYPEFEDKLPLIEVVRSLIKVLDDVISGVARLSQGQEVLDFSDGAGQQISAIDVQRLQKIIPEQRLSPVHFQIIEDRIYVENQNSHPNNNDMLSVDAARAEIIQNGASLVDTLRRSNYDKRLVERLEYIQKQIENGDSAIRIGINNISLGNLSDRLQAELPDSISALIISHSMSINMYVAQFPDWSQFTANAAAVEITTSDLADIQRATRKLVGQLTATKEHVDESVVLAFTQLHDAIQGTNVEQKRSAFSVIRTLENFSIRIFRFIATVLQEYVGETVKQVIKITAKGTAVALLGVALTSSTSLEPLAGRIKELSWVKTAVEIIQKSLHE